MRRFLKFLVIAPLALLFLAFALANRHYVPVSINLLGGDELPLLQAPLFALLFAATALGVLLGWISTWLKQGRFRRAARIHRATAESLRGENEALRGQVATLKTSAPSSSTAIVPTRAA